MSSNETPVERPSRAGQMVRSADGTIGITTEAPKARSARIAVMYVGGRYPVSEQIDELTVCE